MPVHLGQHVSAARRDGDGVILTTQDVDGRTHTIETAHVMAATGYRVRLDALDFVAPELRSELARKGGFPALDTGLQSSVPGLYFTGIQAAATFGPLLRFTCGTKFAAPRLAAAVSANRKGDRAAG